jgi:hypothetical protein
MKLPCGRILAFLPDGKTMLLCVRDFGHEKGGPHSKICWNPRLQEFCGSLAVSA